MTKRNHKFKYLRTFIREKKIKDGFMKRGIYASLFNLPKKMKKSLSAAKNRNHKEYMINTFLKIARKAESKEVIDLLLLEKDKLA